MNGSRASVLLLVPLAALALSGSLRGDSAAEKDVTVSLCDGESVMTLPGVKPGQELAPAEARKVAGEMMLSWRRTRGEERWASWSAEAALAPAPRVAQSAAPAAAAPDTQPTKF